MTAEAVNTPQAVALYGLLPVVAAFVIAFSIALVRSTHPIRHLLDRIEARLQAAIDRRVDIALTGPWSDGIDQAAVDRIWAAIAADLDCSALPTYNPEGQQR